MLRVPNQLLEVKQDALFSYPAVTAWDMYDGDVPVQRNGTVTTSQSLATLSFTIDTLC